MVKVMDVSAHHETAREDRISLSQKVIYSIGSLVNNIQAAAHEDQQPANRAIVITLLVEWVDESLFCAIPAGQDSGMKQVTFR